MIDLLFNRIDVILLSVLGKPFVIFEEGLHRCISTGLSDMD
jgi:hypothetical protein